MAYNCSHIVLGLLFREDDRVPRGQARSLIPVYRNRIICFGVSPSIIWSLSGIYACNVLFVVCTFAYAVYELGRWSGHMEEMVFHVCGGYLVEVGDWLVNRV